MEKKKIEDEDIKLWHKIIYYQKCAQIAALESEISQYEKLKEAVSSLMNDLESCVSHLKSTHTYASSGVSCVDFDENIGKIGKYAKSMESVVGSLDGVIESIKDEITKREEDITNIKSTMWI